MHPRLRTPVAATVAVLLVTLPIAILSDLPSLVNMVAVGNLANFAVVALALMWARYAPAGGGLRGSKMAAVLLVLLTAAAAGGVCGLWLELCAGH